MEIAGYLASILIGISLGLMGGGGSILTVPVLVYLFGVDALMATTYSLFIVGTTSIVGSVSYLQKKLVDTSTVINFGLPSIAAVWLTRTYIVPSIPATIFTAGNFVLSSNTLLLLLFAILMVLAAFSMIKKNNEKNKRAAIKDPSRLVVVAQGAGVGIVTGLVGAGGGFLIIPALVNFMKLPMKTAVGTSLFIIAINSLMGFLFSKDHGDIQWSLLLTVTIIAIVGIFIGSYLSTKIDGKKLKPAFGWFVLVMGVYIILKEMVFQ
jgi:uncharacterized protein